jgi:LysM repeat protein/ABC-type branched-subunit amino acid transport system substrate-binding protein
MIKDLFQKKQFLFIVVLTFCVLSFLHSQDKDVGRRIMIEGKEYFLHVVEQSEGFYSIARQYNVSQQEIFDANPEMSDGLKKGQVIRIPVIKGRNTNAYEINRSGDFILHSVEKGQTTWYISRKYNVDIEEIYRHNPGSDQKLTAGSILKVPVSDRKTDADEGVRRFYNYTVKSGDTLYSISKRYDVSVDDIVKYNPALQTGVLSVGSVVRIPRFVPETEQSGSGVTSESGIIEGKDFIYHEIESGQTLYSISRRYQMDVDRIKSFNPDVNPNDLREGYMLRIPRKIEKQAVDQQKPDDRNFFETHGVRRKETLFSISRRYNVDMETIRKVNPGIDFSNLRKGSELKIPQDQWFVQNYPGLQAEDKAQEPMLADSLRIKTFEPSDSLCVNYEGIGLKRPVKVALMLPFALDETEQENISVKMGNGDTIKSVRKNPVISRKSRVFAEFYEGALLALDELKKQNINVDLSVYDISPNSAMVERIIKSNPQLKDVDMIIGPARSDDLSVISDFAIKHKIKVVYPLSNVNPELTRNPYIFQINTPDTLAFDRMANEIVRQSEGYNLLAIIPENDDKYASAFLEKLRQEVFFNEFALKKDINYREYRMIGKEDQTNLEALLDPLKKNIVVLPTNQEATISKIVPTLSGIVRKRKIDVSLFGMTEWLRAQSINPEDMFTLKAQVFTFFAFDYDSSETGNFIKKYHNWYHTEPHAVSSYFQNSSNSSGYSRYGAWGYDVTYYFISAMSKRGVNFEYCPNPLDLHSIQFNFSFKRVSNWGGFYNQGLFVLKFLPGFNVQRVPVLSLQPTMQFDPENTYDTF